MRRLTTATTALFAFGFALLLGMPWLLRAQPARTAGEMARAQFALYLTLYAMGLLVIFFAICVLSWRIVVKQREEFRAQSERNLQDLIEGTLSDHERKQQTPQSDA
jgi:mannose/fructose/N-acetylgalactosamine-specific phosphotransferase system component IIC